MTPFPSVLLGVSVSSGVAKVSVNNLWIDSVGRLRSTCPCDPTIRVQLNLSFTFFRTCGCEVTLFSILSTYIRSHSLCVFSFIHAFLSLLIFWLPLSFHLTLCIFGFTNLIDVIHVMMTLWLFVLLLSEALDAHMCVHLSVVRYNFYAAFAVIDVTVGAVISLALCDGLMYWRWIWWWMSSRPSTHIGFLFLKHSFCFILDTHSLSWIFWRCIDLFTCFCLCLWISLFSTIPVYNYRVSLPLTCLLLSWVNADSYSTCLYVLIYLAKSRSSCCSFV